MDSKTYYMTERKIPHYTCDYCAYPIYNNIDELWHSRNCKGYEEMLNANAELELL